MSTKTARVPSAYLPVFCRELYQLVRAGVPTADGLAMLREDETDPQVLSWLQVLCERADEGASLTEALRDSGAFPAYMTDMIGLAEDTGRLEESLLSLQRYYERQNRMRSDIRGAVAVPVTLLIVMIAVVLLLITQVLPVFDRVFAQLGVRMGSVATGLMNAGVALARAGTGIAAVLAALAVIALLIACVPALRDRFSGWFRRSFGGRGVLGQMAVSRFASAMAMSVSSGMNMEEGVGLAAKLCGGAREIDEKTARCRKEIEDGAGAAEALSNSGLFSARECLMLKLAERTGSLGETLEDLARREEEESIRQIDRTVSAVEPAIVVITSVLAGVILVSVMLPLMGLLSTL